MRKARASTVFGRLALATAALAFTGIVGTPMASHASTAAGTKISTIATVNYNDSANLPQASVNSAPVVVTVTLVPSAVNITPSIVTNTVFEGTNTTVTYTVFGTANGKDSYSFSSSETRGAATISTVSGTVTPFAPATLAGTTLAATASNGNGFITVPYDQSGGNAATGLVAGPVGTGTLLRIGGNTYTVTAITPNAGANTMDLTLSVPLAGLGAPLAVGTVVGEQKTFSVSYPSGVLTGATTGTQTANATVTSTTGPNPAATSSNTVITVNVNPATLTIVKSACSTDPTGAVACFGAAANAAPGGTIIYKIVVQNTGTGVAKAVTVTDTLQKYITYILGAAKYATGLNGVPSLLAYNSGSLTALSEGVGGYDVLPLGAPSSVNRRNITYASPVDLPAGNELVLFYEVTVD
jgi:uncharacterized repeat protein (TIGR01451 family)